jgi:hypothetical protein
VADPFAEPTGVHIVRTPETPGPAFPASFQSECAGCDGAIWEGDEIRMFQGEAYHDEEGCLGEDYPGSDGPWEDATWD